MFEKNFIQFYPNLIRNITERFHPETPFLLNDLKS